LTDCSEIKTAQHHCEHSETKVTIGQNAHPLKADYANIHRDIIERCKLGDGQAQHQLYQLYAKPMFTVTMRIMRNQMEAEDVLQECFADAFTKLDTWRGESSFGAWFKRIVVNKSLNSIKKKRLPTTDFDEINEDRIEEVEESDELDRFPYNVAQVQEATEQLPEGYRIVFTLFLLEGYSHKEIADELDITESTSKSQFNRAKKKLRGILSET
jgi:RNA polymerase sigma factor (sigma-70 family)